MEKRRPLFYKQTTLQRNKRTLLEANSALKIIIFHLAAFFIHCIFIYIFFIFDFFRDANCASVRTGNYALAYVTLDCFSGAPLSRFLCTVTDLVYVVVLRQVLAFAQTIVKYSEMLYFRDALEYILNCTNNALQRNAATKSDYWGH